MVDEVRRRIQQETLGASRPSRRPVVRHPPAAAHRRGTPVRPRTRAHRRRSGGRRSRRRGLVRLDDKSSCAWCTAPVTRTPPAPRRPTLTTSPAPPTSPKPTASHARSDGGKTPCSPATAATASATLGPKPSTGPMKKVKRVGHGFRNLRNYRLRLLLHCGGVSWQHQPATRLRGRAPQIAVQSPISPDPTRRSVGAHASYTDEPCGAS